MVQYLIQEKDIQTFNIIAKSFLEVETMHIPLIQYCIMKKAIECFKYLLVNSFDDPNKTMEEQNPFTFYSKVGQRIQIKKYEWDYMATAIYFGNKEVIKILEVKGINKGKNESHIEAAILSYRNTIEEEILENISKEKNDIIENHLKIALISSGKNNNIKGAELLIRKGVNINIIDIIIVN